MHRYHTAPIHSFTVAEIFRGEYSKFNTQKKKQKFIVRTLAYVCGLFLKICANNGKKTVRQ